MASTSHFVELAKTLPAPLQRFFARFPPAAILPEGHPPTRYQEARPDPFRFYRNPATGRWQDPVYSKRRQAELVKMAQEHGVEELLPATDKKADVQLAIRVEKGLRVKGTGVGQKVKGHIYERHMIAKYVGCPVAWQVVPGHAEKSTLTPFGQDGGEKKGYAGNAEAHQGLAKGEKAPLCIQSDDCLSGLLIRHRPGGGTGPSFPRHNLPGRLVSFLLRVNPTPDGTRFLYQ